MLGGIEVFNAQLVFHKVDAFFLDADGTFALIYFIVNVTGHAGNDLREHGVPLGGTVRRTGNNQRRAGFVNEDRVHLVNDGVVVRTLHEFVDGARHVIAQVVEAQFVVGAVGDVGVVCVSTLLRGHVRKNHIGGQSQEAVHTTHPLRVALGKVVIDGDHVHAFAFEGIEVGGQHTGEGLAFTGAHFGDVAKVECSTTHDLHGVVFLVQYSPRGFTRHGEGFQQNIVKRFALFQAFFELRRFGLQFLIAEISVFRLKCDHLVGDLFQALYSATFTDAEDLGQSKHRRSSFSNFGFRVYSLD